MISGMETGTVMASIVVSSQHETEPASQFFPGVHVSADAVMTS